MTAAGSRRAALLVGTAMCSLLAQPAAAADDKWMPYAEIYGRAGSERALGGGEVFFPLHQSDDDLLFLDLRGRADTDDTAEGNLGLAYRAKIEDSVVLGGYGYVDVQRSALDNTFWNLTVGLEALSRDWDLRVNGYLPLSEGKAVQEGTELVLTDTFIGLRSGEEAPLHGLDAEVGWRVPLLPAEGDQEVRIFAGGYWFAGDDLDTVAGPRARLEYRLYDPFGNGSRLTFDTVAQWDDVRGADLSAGITLRVPFTFFEAQQQTKLTGLDRRMVDRIQRDVDIVTGSGLGDIEAVKVENLLTATNQIRFVQSDGSVQGAADEMGEAGIIVAQGDSGPLGGPVTLHAGQALIGGGHTVKLTGAETGTVVSFTPAGARPQLEGNGAVAVQLAEDNFVGGLDIIGSYGYGIVGEVNRAHIRGNLLSPDEGNTITGISLRSEDPIESVWIIDGNEVRYFGGGGIALEALFHGSGDAQTVQVRGNLVTDIAGDAISLRTSAGTGATSQSVTVEGNLIANIAANGDGLKIYTEVEGGGDLTHNLIVSGNDLFDIEGDAILLTNHVVGYPARLTQQVDLEDNLIQGAQGDGVAVDTNVNADGRVGQDIRILDNALYDVGGTGVILRATAGFHGHLEQDVVVRDNRVRDSFDGYAFLLESEDSDVTQRLEVADNVAGGIDNDGFQFQVGSDPDGDGMQPPFFIEDSIVEQTITLAGNEVEDVDGLGFEFESYIGEETVFTRRVVASDNAADTGDYAAFRNAVLVVGEEEPDEDDFSYLDDQFTLADNSFSAVASAAVDFSYEYALAAEAVVLLTFERNELSAGGAGIAIDQTAAAEAYGEMAVEIRGNTVENSGTGFKLSNSANYAGAVQDASIVDNTITGTLRGLDFDNTSDTGGAIQDIALSGNSITGAVVGADIYNELVAVGVANQHIDFSAGGNSIEASNVGINAANFGGSMTLDLLGGVDIVAGGDELSTVNTGILVVNP